MVDSRDLRKVLCLRPEPLHVLPARVPELLSSAGSVGDATGLPHHLAEGARGVHPVIPVAAQTSGRHLLKADDHDAVGGAVRNHVLAHEEARRARAAVVVDVVDGDPREAELVEYALPAGGIAVAVACDALFDVVVVDLRIEERFDTGFVAELGVVDFSAWFDELGHSDAEDVDGGGGFLGCHVEVLGCVPGRGARCTLGIGAVPLSALPFYRYEQMERSVFERRGRSLDS